MPVVVVLALALAVAFAWAVADAGRHPDRWRSPGDRRWRTAAWAAAFTAAVVAGAALGGAGWQEIAALLLVGWIVARILALLLADGALLRWLYGRRGRPPRP
jgi:fructose-specific phosphotransferase system IIC component